MATEQSKQFGAEIAANQPANTTILITNIDDLQVWIVLPESGNLWVGYEYQDQPAQEVYIWHQGGTTTQVPPGFNTFPVGAGDMLVYALAYPQQVIKLGWAYV
jgi:hypothetical protein